MAAGQIGFFTNVMEALATAVGAGIVLGGFLAGAVGAIAGWPRVLRDERVLITGYGGGIAGVVAAVIDLLVRYSE
ncbi:MAG TPA: hypothetical protein VFY48_05730 [Solirubrobacterales bacterium]|nr:hypothetical protein [Solirubrobacterales bacterium]